MRHNETCTYTAADQISTAKANRLSGANVTDFFLSFIRGGRREGWLKGRGRRVEGGGVC